MRTASSERPLTIESWNASCAEAGHVLCAPCLERWARSQSELRAQKGLTPLLRQTCPVCRTELRVASGVTRGA